MASKTSLKQCDCIHCQEKKEQIERSRLYWSQLLEIKLKN